jgi:hypothetical protein
MCLSGIHEVARELENPFRNVPNEIPLVTMMAHFNEALITMYAGYHPDHYWDDDRRMRKRTEARKQAQAPKASCSDKTAEENRVGREEISMLKRQLEEQAKLIARLASKIDMDPVEETERVEKMLQNGVVENITVHA